MLEVDQQWPNKVIGVSPVLINSPYNSAVVEVIKSLLIVEIKGLPSSSGLECSNSSSF